MGASGHEEMPLDVYVRTQSGWYVPSLWYDKRHLQLASVLMEAIRPQLYSHPLRGLSLLLRVWIILLMTALWDVPPLLPHLLSAIFELSCKQGTALPSITAVFINRQAGTLLPAINNCLKKKKTLKGFCGRSNVWKKYINATTLCR